MNSYISGAYDKGEGFQRLNIEIKKYEKGGQANRVFYLALPPTVYHDVTTHIQANCMSDHEWASIQLC